MPTIIGVRESAVVSLIERVKILRKDYSHPGLFTIAIFVFSRTTQLHSVLDEFND